jgi:dTDP-D-glucose 4,6-dehydratase
MKSVDMGSESLPEKSFLALNARKAVETIGWMPKMDIGTAIAWTVDWYASYLRGVDGYQLVTDQVESYLRMAPGVAQTR